MKKSPVSEAECTIWLDSKMPIAPLCSDFIRRITQDWLRSRRAAGIEPYSDESLVEAVECLVENVDGG